MLGAPLHRLALLGLTEGIEVVIQTDCRCGACSWQSFGRDRDLL